MKHRNAFLLVAGLTSFTPAAAHATPDTWATTGSMSTARYYHTATLLPNGKVLVAGGSGIQRK